MFRKKYGKITFSAWVNAEMEQTRIPAAIAGGILLTAVCVAVQIISGTPYRVILELGIGDLVPPVWLLILLRLLSLATAGIAAGLVLGCRERRYAVEKYRSCMLFILLAALELCWYPTLFCGGWVFLGLLETLLMIFLTVCVTAGFLRVFRISGLIFVLHSIWVTYLLILTFAIFFRN